MKNFDVTKLACELITAMDPEEAVIELPSRGSDNYLMLEEGDKYQLISEHRNERLIYSDDNTKIEAVDPPDGPYMPLGYKISGRVLTKIEYLQEDDKLILTMTKI